MRQKWFNSVVQNLHCSINTLLQFTCKYVANKHSLHILSLPHNLEPHCCKTWQAAYPNLLHDLPAWSAREIEVFSHTASLFHLSIYMEHHPIPSPAPFHIQGTSFTPDHTVSVQPSPIRLGNLAALLHALELHQEFQDVLSGFQHGFRLGYMGPRTSGSTPSTLPVDPTARQQLLSYIARELAIGRLIGPIPRETAVQLLEWMRTSPVSLIPKKNMGIPIADKWRMIQNLSWGKRWGTSVNNGIPSEHTTCVFVSVYDVVKDVVQDAQSGNPTSVKPSNSFRFTLKTFLF